MKLHICGRCSTGVVDNFLKRTLLFGFHRRQGLQLQMSLHQFPQLLPVLILHMHEFHAIPFWPNIPHYRRKMNLT
jgi:hypothetical protein